MSYKPSEMAQRIGVGGVLASALIGLIFLSPYAPWSGIFLFLLTCVALFAVQEYYELVRARQEAPFVWWGYAATALYLILHGLVLHHYLPYEIYRLFWIGALISLFSIALFFPKDSLSAIALTFFALCYIVAPLGEILTINYTPIQGDDLRLWLLYGIGLTKITDTAALFIGRRFGKHLLAERLSPKKTWEGAVGGLAAGIIWSLIFAVLVQKFSLKMSLNMTEALLLGCFLSLFGQLGDMAESLLKRDAGVKDSGFLPGLGGVLDLIDSLLFTMPLLACFLRYRFAIL